MTKVKCPIEGCEYEADNENITVVSALLNIHASTHAVNPTTPSGTGRMDKLKRPSIKLAGSSEDWQYFETRWEEYRTGTKIHGSDVVTQLLECCDEGLRKDLTHAAGGSMIGKEEKDVLEAIKALAVRRENTMVARATLHNMRQDRDETIRSFGARIKGQAGICNYIIECPKCRDKINYTDAILRDVLSRGIIDPEIQLDILGNTNQDMLLEDLFKTIEAKESGKRSASRLLDSQSSDAASSTYRQGRREAMRGRYPEANDKTTPGRKYQETPKTNLGRAEGKKCGYCGGQGHGRSAPPYIREKECPAYNHKCKHCHRLHHLDSQCRSKNTTTDACEEEGAIFNELCTVTAIGGQNGNRPITMDHHQYSNLHERWTRRPSNPQPYIRLRIRASKEDYRDLGYKLTTPTQPLELQAMADTGCQSCLVGIRVFNRLGLKRADLIPVTMKMHTANNKGIRILGAAVLRFSGKGERSHTLETRQITYVTDSTEKIFLCREACVDLGIISESFPTVGEVTHIDAVQPNLGPLKSDNGITSPCDCDKRALPPPPPEKAPFPATEANQARLQSYLIDYYKSSTFNTCQHQILPMMSGPPMRLIIDPKAKPKAFHTPIPVALHWQAEVKAGLDQDVRLGVIEPVPIGTPVTWCHRMVICAKKTGKPRRTVDFQPLNEHVTRDTHHTQSPFHQARSIPRDKLKTVFDAWNGYHSVPLHDDDRHYTTFITPWGRYRYCTAPQGYIASGDGYSRRYDEIVSDIPNKTKCVDDTLLWSDSIEESFHQAVQWLDICGRNGITLNPDKFTCSKPEVEFAGFVISMDSVRPCGKYLEAIRDFPTPRNITDIRSWFGLVNQVSYAFSMAERMIPFRQLLKPGVLFKWDDELDGIFRVKSGNRQGN